MVYTAGFIMVKITKVYTRTGDEGLTGLGTGARVPKHDRRVEAYGAVDEANAALHLAIAAAGDPAAGPDAPSIAEALAGVGHDMFDVGADLCTPIVGEEPPGEKLRVVPEQTARLEALIDRFNEDLPALTSFVLPGGTELAARLHLARTVTRRAERSVVALAEAEPDATNADALRYLNRLSDLLFVLGRVANLHAGGDVLWQPGKTRPGGGA